MIPSRLCGMATWSELCRQIPHTPEWTTPLHKIHQGRRVWSQDSFPGCGGREKRRFRHNSRKSTTNLPTRTDTYTTHLTIMEDNCWVQSAAYATECTMLVPQPGDEMSYHTFWRCSTPMGIYPKLLVRCTLSETPPGGSREEGNDDSTETGKPKIPQGESEEGNDDSAETAW